MAKEGVDELVQVLRAIGFSINTKLTSLLNFLVHHKNASSFGAVAGFAIALVCTWKYLRTPGRRPKRIVKLETPSSSNAASDDNSGASSTAVALSASQPRQRGVAIQEPATCQLTLAQTVRKQLKGVRKVTCQLLGVVFQETTPEDLQKHAVVRPEVVGVLLELAQTCDLYLMTRVADDASEDIALAALDAVGLFTLGAYNRNKVLFCSSEVGRCSFVRQIEPDWHIDTSAEIITQLARYIHHQLLISSQRSSSITSSSLPSNVIEAETIESYFGKL